MDLDLHFFENSLSVNGSDTGETGELAQGEGREGSSSQRGVRLRSSLG